MNDDLKMIQLMLLTLGPITTFQALFCFNRTIHTKRTRLERERSTHYNRSYSRISELEEWMMLWRWSNWCCWHYDVQRHFKHCFITTITARSIRNELDLNEKDRPTTTEVTAESVKWNNQLWIQDATTDAVDTMTTKDISSTVSLPPSPQDQYGTN